MAKINFSRKLRDAVENYYTYNPDTLMPLMMITLAAQEKLHVSTNPTDKETVLYSISPNEVINYDWVLLDFNLKKKIREAIANGVKSISVVCDFDPFLNDIYSVFHHYDTFTVDEEFHFRMGMLKFHSSNIKSEQAIRQYAAICLAEALVNTPTDWLKDRFLVIANHMLVKSGLQPERPRLRVAQTLCALLNYDGKGKVYNPFAGCAIAAAMIPAGENMYADGNANDKLFAVSLLLNYGMGGSNIHFEKRDSEKWTDQGKFDYILSTYRGYVGGKSAFDFCLSKSFDTLTESGRFAGIVSPKDIFEQQSSEMKEALKRDWVETIVLLPFGEVAVLVNAKKAKELKGLIKFFNITHPMLIRRMQFNGIEALITDDCYADFLNVSDVKKKGYLRSIVVPEFTEREGFDVVRLGDIVTKVKRQTYSLSRFSEDKRVVAYIDRSHQYNVHEPAWMQGIKKKSRTYIFAPAYHIEHDSLITNNKGRLEPRLFNADTGSAFFQDGYVFELSDEFDNDYDWLINELNKPYVQRQLHPYGMDEMVPETMTEEQILDLKLYKETNDTYDFEESESDPDSGKLPQGFILKGLNTEYTIHKFLGHGFFGYTYTALSNNLTTGEQKEVVIKEFYPHRYFHREGVKAVLNDNSTDIYDDRQKFFDEAQIMNKLGNIQDSHIVPAYEVFENEETGTVYYVMPFYHDGSLLDLQRSGFDFTEEMVLKNVVKPLCKALHIAHSAKVLHLDIKPENILVDENGDAILIDFGVAKQYDKFGEIINNEGHNSGSVFAAPELKGGNMVHFGAQTDIFSLAASIYNLITNGRCPHAIYAFSDYEINLRERLNDVNCSPKFTDAIIAGLQSNAMSRPANAQAFLNLFPGCEKIKL